MPFSPTYFQYIYKYTWLGIKIYLSLVGNNSLLPLVLRHIISIFALHQTNKYGKTAFTHLFPYGHIAQGCRRHSTGHRHTFGSSQRPHAQISRQHHFWHRRTAVGQCSRVWRTCCANSYGADEGHTWQRHHGNCCGSVW